VATAAGSRNRNTGFPLSRAEAEDCPITAPAGVRHILGAPFSLG